MLAATTYTNDPALRNFYVALVGVMVVTCIVYGSWLMWRGKRRKK